jgi:hypothetical protein
VEERTRSLTTVGFWLLLVKGKDRRGKTRQSSANHTLGACDYSPRCSQGKHEIAAEASKPKVHSACKLACKQNTYTSWITSYSSLIFVKGLPTIHEPACLRSTRRLTVPISEPAYFATGSHNRDDEKTMLNELVPTEACRNSSGAGTSLFWSSVVRYTRDWTNWSLVRRMRPDNTRMHPPNNC